MAQEILPAGCFGKIPTYGDFIRHGTGGSEIGELDGWIQQGIAYCLRKDFYKWEEAFIQASPQYFLFHTRDARKFFVGVLQPSVDAIGRIYPFLVFLEVDCLQFGNNITIAPIVFGSFLAAAAEIAARSGRGIVSLSELHHAIAEMDFAVPRHWDTYIASQHDWLAATNLSQMLSMLYGGFEEEKKFALFGKLGEIMLKLRGYNPAQWDPGIGFPLTGGEEFMCHLMSFWLQLIWRMLHKPVAAPFIFWPAAGVIQSRRMWIFFRPPSGELFMPILSASYESERLIKLDQAGRPAEESIPLPYRASLMQSLTNESITLFDFLRQF